MTKNTPDGKGTDRKNGSLRKENEELRDRVRELEETLDAIRSGEVDAIVVSEGDSRQIYTLEGADHPYRALVENIQEGALTISRDGIILYTNARFAGMVLLPPDKVPGTSILDYVCPDHREDIEKALAEIHKRACRSHVRIKHGKGSLPVLISMNLLDHGGDKKISVVITDRRKDEDRIMLQSRMLDSVGDAVIAADTQNKIIYWNDAATKTYGWEPEEALGQDLIDIATPEISQKDAREIAERLKNGETWAGEYIVRHRDGHEFPIHASDAPIFDDEGKLIAIIGASHDITDRKRAEEALRESEARFRSLAENSPSVLQRFDRQLRVVYISPLAAEITGIPAEAFIGKTNREIGMPEDLCRLWEKAQNEVFETGQNRDVEFDITTPVGERTFLLRFAPEWAADGSIAYILGISTEITDRKRAEEALRQSEARFRLALRNAPVSVSLADTDLVYRWAYNQKARRPDEIVGKTDADLFAREDVEWIIPLKQKILETGEDVHTENWLTSNGVRMYLDLYLEPQRDSSGVITGIGIAAVDLTDLKLAKEDLLKKNEDLNCACEEITAAHEELRQNVDELSKREHQLAEALAEKEILLSEVHHRVKNNLSAFISLLSLDGSYVDTEEGKSLRKDLQNRARSMALIHETLYKTGKFSTVDMEIYLSTLVRQVSDSYVSGRAVRIDVNARGATMDISRATTAGLIINELVTNSYKYAFPAGFDCMTVRGEPCTIRVLFSHDNGDYILAVSDNGCGLPAGLDPCETKSLGLKLVTFLARNQLRAEISISRENGSAFVFRMKQKEGLV
jgi:PAS domain S-box-containing protein